MSRAGQIILEQCIKGWGGCKTDTQGVSSAQTDIGGKYREISKSFMHAGTLRDTM